MNAISVIVRVSYTEDKELQEVLMRLKPITKKYKVAKEKKGEYKNAYVEINT